MGDTQAAGESCVIGEPAARVRALAPYKDFLTLENGRRSGRPELRASQIRVRETLVTRLARLSNPGAKFRHDRKLICGQLDLLPIDGETQ